MATDPIRQIKKAITAALKADALSERAHMDLVDGYNALKFGRKTLSPEGEKVMERMNRALDQLSDSRGSLGDAVYQLEQALK